jgi:uncharacterized protein (TIGR00369 family)
MGRARETPVRFHPEDPAYDARVRASFARQAFMTTLGAQLVTIEPGRVVIELPFRADLAQQHGFLHAGAATAVVDSACGYAALTLMPPAAAVLSVEFKVNLLAPGAGARFRAMGRVIRAGRTLTVCSGELIAVREGADAEGDPGLVVALMQATMMAVRERAGLSD